MTVLADRLNDYLALRSSLGHKLAEAHRLLPRFVTYLHQQGAEFVTVQLALDWATERKDLPVGSVVAANRMMHVRGFAKYLSGIDPKTEVPPAGVLRRPHRWRQPFIYTDADVLGLIEHAGRLPQPLRSATYQTLIGLLASTGLRVGEALRLDRGDLDTSDGILTIRESKFGKSRLVPLQTSTVEALERYEHTRRRLLPDPATDALFVSLTGRRVIYESVWPLHRQLCEQAGVGTDSPITPRIHDHRHTFAVNTMLGWYSQGVDVPARISLLSTYLGHREPRYTYHYLSAAPELLAHAARLLDGDQQVRS